MTLSIVIKTEFKSYIFLMFRPESLLDDRREESKPPMALAG